MLAETMRAILHDTVALSRRAVFRLAVMTVLVSSVGWLASCSQSSATPAEVVVEMNDQLRFVPNTVTIRVGDSVTWQNTGRIEHTSTGDPAKATSETSVKLPDGAEPWDSGIIAGGGSWSHRFDVPGEYTYFCIPHEQVGMVGFRE